MPSATTAYRQDVRHNGGVPFGEHDSAWIVAVTIVEQAALASGEHQAGLLVEAGREAARVLGDEQRRYLAFRDWNEPGTEIGSITLLSARLQDIGAMALATCVIDAGLKALGSADSLERGRMVAQRARIAYHTTDYDFAESLYPEVDEIGRRLGVVELRARHAHGVMAMAQVRGNYPRHLEAAKAALEWADAAGIPHFQRSARYSLMRNAAMRKDWSVALEYAWQLVGMSHGDNTEEGRALQAMGMLMLEMGDRVSARSAFSAVLSRAFPVKTHLSALGGLALATAGHPADEALFEWAVSEVVHLRESVAARFAYVQALLECAIALRAAGQHARSSELRDQVIVLARRHGYAELLYRADELEQIGQLADRVREQSAASVVDDFAIPEGQLGVIVESVRKLQPARLPRHVTLAAASHG